jgi:hypothetical protein
VLVGVKVTDRVWLPALSTVPVGGEYTKPPATDAVALSCLLLRAVPYVMADGFAQVIFGVAGFTCNVTEALAVV